MRDQVIVDKMPIKFPNNKDFKLNSLKIDCSLFDVQFESILPTNGCFYGSKQPWNVKDFQLTVNILEVNLSDPNQLVN